MPKYILKRIVGTIPTLIIVVTFVSVSYTHLDVYKRQV